MEGGCGEGVADGGGGGGGKEGNFEGEKGDGAGAQVMRMGLESLPVNIMLEAYGWSCWLGLSVSFVGSVRYLIVWKIVDCIRLVRRYGWGIFQASSGCKYQNSFSF